VPLVKDEYIYKALTKLGIKSLKVPSNYILFCMRVKKLDVHLFILFTDTLSPHAQWLQRKYKTILINDEAIDKDSFYYLTQSNSKTPSNPFYIILFNIFGLYGVLYDKKLEQVPRRINDVIRYVFYKLFYGFKFNKILPGFFSDIVLLPREELINIYQENGFDEKKLKLINSPYIAYLSDLAGQHSPVKKDIDVLLFSQPLYYYVGGENWLDEVENLVNDCNNHGKKLVILLHPRDDLSMYEIFSDRCEICFNNNIRSDLENLKYVVRSNLVVVKSSTIRIMPLIFKIPVAFINYYNVTVPVNSCIKDSYHSDLILESLGDIKILLERIEQNQLDYIEIQNTYLELKKVFYDGDHSLKPISDAIDSLCE